MLSRRTAAEVHGQMSISSRVDYAYVSSLASHTVLATLHVPVPQSKTDVQQYLDDDDAKEDKERRLA